MNGPSTTIPAIFREGHAKARTIDPRLADAYVAHTVVGDPPADAVIAVLAEVTPERRSRLVEALVMSHEDELRDAPQELRDFASLIASPEADGASLDPDLARAGSACFYMNADMFLLSLIAIGLIENYASLMSRSFLSTGYTTQQSVKRMGRSLLQVTESMLPGGLDRQGDGWRLTVRARLVHAQARRNLSEMEGWDAETYGVPVSAAHLAYSVATFSARALRGVDRLGVRAAGKGREGYMHLWRYIGWLVGTPPALLPGDEAEALLLARVGGICEPAPIVDSIIMAHTTINSAALTLGIEDDDARRQALTDYGYRISRALIGNKLADQLQFPKARTFGLLAAMRWKRRLDVALGRVSPRARAETFMALLEATELRSTAFDFDLPDLRYA